MLIKCSNTNIGPSLSQSGVVSQVMVAELLSDVILTFIIEQLYQADVTTSNNGRHIRNITRDFSMLTALFCRFLHCGKLFLLAHDDTMLGRHL